MKNYILPSIRLTVVLMVILCVLYPLGLALAGKFSSGSGGGEKVTLNHRVVGYAKIGQSFTSPTYFWGRPSAVNYNAAGSAGSNKAASNPAYLEEVSGRIDTLLKYHPYLERKDIPSDLVTASGSGLDPDISVAAAKIQVKRVAEYRKLNEAAVQKLVDKHTSKPLLGLFGPEKVNVLQLNIGLDQLSK